MSISKLIFLFLTMSEGVKAFQICGSLSQRGRKVNLQANLIAGINKYSHDASVCLIHEDTGEILFTQAKERLTGKKHEGGGVADLMEYACRRIGADILDIKTVVNQNHHYRVNPYEHRLPFATALNYENQDNLRTANLLSHAKRYELSHHLAHAWSVVGTCPYDKGLILVMDGMGESYQAMVEDMSGIETLSGDYMHDLKLIKGFGGEDFVGQPVSLAPASGEPPQEAI